MLSYESHADPEAVVLSTSKLLRLSFRSTSLKQFATHFLHPNTRLLCPLVLRAQRKGLRKLAHRMILLSLHSPAVSRRYSRVRLCRTSPHEIGSLDAKYHVPYRGGQDRPENPIERSAHQQIWMESSNTSYMAHDQVHLKGRVLFLLCTDHALDATNDRRRQGKKVSTWLLLGK